MSFVLEPEGTERAGMSEAEWAIISCLHPSIDPGEHLQSSYRNWLGASAILPLYGHKKAARMDWF